MAVFNILTKISEDWTSTTMRRAGAVGTLQRGDRGTAGPSPPQPEPPRHLEELMSPLDTRFEESRAPLTHG